MHPTEDCFDYGMDLQGIPVMDTVMGVENTEDCQLECQVNKHLIRNLKTLLWTFFFAVN